MTDLPQIGLSVILIIRNDAHLLECALRSLSLAVYDHSFFEVIVVDDGSDPPLDRCLSLQFDFRFKYCYMERSDFSSRSRSRNYGASQAGFERLLFVDGDHFFRPNTLLNFGRYFTLKPRKKVVLGTRSHLRHHHWSAVRESLKAGRFPEQKLVLGACPDERIQLEKLMSKKFHELSGRWYLFWSCNFCIEKQLFLSSGGFDEQFIGWGLEDVELGYRLTAAGVDYELLHNPVLHFIPDNQITESKYRGWIENIQIFYKKFNDVRILQLFEFEDSIFYNAKLAPMINMNWYEEYANFEVKISYTEEKAHLGN